ncbi:MAG: hypothetical protein JJE55_05185 [Flavobacteriaceae bacterium]|nr:hypothetical protein [Flavobacteriaceae bacterium]
MTNITIKKGKLSKTEFNSTQELYIYLKEKLSPLKLYLVDDESISDESLKKIKHSKNNSHKILTDFQG